MLSKERLYNLYDCINYVKNNKIKGDIVEVGCFKGANLSLCRKFSDKKIFGFDTFEGHPEPNINEIDIWGVNQNKLFNKKHKREREREGARARRRRGVGAKQVLIL